MKYIRSRIFHSINIELCYNNEIPFWPTRRIFSERVSRYIYIYIDSWDICIYVMLTNATIHIHVSGVFRTYTSICNVTRRRLARSSFSTCIARESTWCESNLAQTRTYTHVCVSRKRACGLRLRGKKWKQDGGRRGRMERIVMDAATKIAGRDTPPA